MLHNTRYGLRMLAKNPGFTAVALVTLALGIGANTAIFSVVRAVLLPPLPFAQPDRLVQISARNRKTGEQSNWTAYRDVSDWRAQNHSFHQIGVHGFALLNLTSGSQPDALYGARVSADLLPCSACRLQWDASSRPPRICPAMTRSSSSATIYGNGASLPTGLSLAGRSA